MNAKTDDILRERQLCADTCPPYEPLDVTDIQLALDRMKLLVTFVYDIPVRRIMEQLHREETIVPLLDPTGWMRNRQKARDLSDLLKAIEPLWSYAQKVAKGE